MQPKHFLILKSKELQRFVHGKVPLLSPGTREMVRCDLSIISGPQRFSVICRQA